MKRQKLLHIDHDKLKTLENLSHLHGVSSSEYIRQIIDGHLRRISEIYAYNQVFESEIEPDNIKNSKYVLAVNNWETLGKDLKEKYNVKNLMGYFPTPSFSPIFFECNSMMDSQLISSIYLQKGFEFISVNLKTIMRIRKL